MVRSVIGLPGGASGFRSRAWRLFAVAALTPAIILVGVVTTGPSVRAATPELLLGRPGVGEYQPIVSDGWVAWQQNTRQRPGHFDVYVRPLDGGTRVKVNRNGTNGANGSIDDGVLVYQEFARSRSDIRLFELATQSYTRPPRRVNTRHWEFWPSMSDGMILFGRIYPDGSREILLADVATGRVIRLDRTRRARAFLAPGQVNGSWAVWQRCPTRERCVVVRYDIASGSKERLKRPFESQYAPSIDVDGNAYYARSGGRCGNRVRLVRHPVQGEPEELWRLANGNDVGSTEVSVGDDGAITLLYDQFGCGRPAQADAWRILDADPTVLTVRVDGDGTGVVRSTPPGIECGSDCEDDFAEGAIVTLTASAGPGSTFEGWSGACTGTGTCEVLMSRSRTVAATFTDPDAPGPTGPTNPGPTGPTNPGPTGPTNPGPTGPTNPGPTGP